MTFVIKNPKQQTRNNGWMIIEMIVSLSVLTILLAGFTMTQAGSRELNSFQMVRQRCIAAAQAQLDSIAARGEGLNSAEVQRLWPNVKTVINETPGQGNWVGLTLVEVTATGKSFSRTVQVKFVRYIVKRRKP
jgi:type II secretory pathway pseudopilin PulG